MATLVLLCLSNIFMTFAWYGHLKFLHDKPLWATVLISWGIAFFEYCLMVPANRWGTSVYSATQLKIIQEIITLSVFVVFAMVYLGEKIRWNHVAAFACIIGAVVFTFIREPERTPLSISLPTQPEHTKSPHQPHPIAKSNKG